MNTILFCLIIGCLKGGGRTFLGGEILKGRHQKTFSLTTGTGSANLTKFFKYFLQA
jgi:hypothetical protein